MKTNSRFFAALVLTALLAGIALFLFSAQDHGSVRVLRAAASRDCAPWDGPAFTVSIHAELGSAIQVSIWQSPQILRAAAFSFPGEQGTAMYHPKFGSPQPLSGRVTFRRVEPDLPITGELDLRSADGRQFQGIFEAFWTDAIVACG
jgi:hypothetical protein